MTKNPRSLTDRLVAYFHDLFVIATFTWFGLEPGQLLPLVVYLATVGSGLLLFRNRLGERPFVHGQRWTIGLLMCVEIGGLVLIVHSGFVEPVRLGTAIAAWVAVRALMLPKPAPAKTLASLPDRARIEPDRPGEEDAQ